MPLAAILVGLIMIDVAFRGTEHMFAKQLAADFGGDSSFLSWLAAIMVVGALGYAAPLRKLSDLLMALIIVVLVLRNGGFFQQVASVIENPPASIPGPSLASYYSGSSSGTDLLGDAETAGIDSLFSSVF